MAINIGKMIIIGREPEVTQPSGLESIHQKIAKEKARIEKEKRAREIEERQRLRDLPPEDLKMFKDSSEETKTTFIIDRDSDYLTDIIK